LARLAPIGPIGFYTEEIRKGGRREGFKLISSDGRSAVLSHVRIRSPHRVGKYGVDVHGFEAFMDRIPFTGQDASLVIIDEIGKMECFSEKFKKLLIEMLDAPKLVISTIAMKGGGIIADIKKRPDINLFELTRSNRNALLEDILTHIPIIYFCA
jgi:nucleoside-triphosphatase